ncbi:MAG: hypothetical protein RIT81_01860 [Deltaproteobacteria bacterium]
MMVAADNGPPEIWARVAAGTATPSELAALEAEARHDPSVRAMLEACRPPDATADERLAANLSRGIRQRKGRSRRRWAGLSVAMAVAASAVLWIALPPKEALPAYAIEVGRGESEMRGGDAPELTELLPSSRLRLVLRPEVPPSGRVVFTAFVESERGLEPWPAPLEISERGAARLDERVGTLWPNRTGDLTLVFLIGRRDATLEQAAVRSTEAWRRVEHPIRIRPEHE